jgi:hypothetical protein
MVWDPLKELTNAPPLSMIRRVQRKGIRMIEKYALGWLELGVYTHSLFGSIKVEFEKSHALALAR